VAFAPGDPWPDTTYPGGAISPYWSGYVRLVVQAQIAAGTPFRMGPDPNDNLNRGNVLTQPGLFPLAAAQQSGLWVDLSCDLVDLELALGAHASQGILTKTDAGTLSATLADPTGKYDPLNPDGLYSLGNSNRLAPGVQIRAFAEVIDTNMNTIVRFALFTGTADRWETSWTQWAGDRETKLVATDTTKQFVKADREEQPPQGAGDFTITRLQRIIDFHTLNTQLSSYFVEGNVTLQATTLAQSAWEQVGRTMDDELGVAYFEPTPPTATWTPTLTWFGRPTWTSDPMLNNTISLGCAPAGDPNPSGWYDIVTDAQPAAFDALLHNAVHASRSGGTLQTVTNQTSIDKYGQADLQRNDLGLNDDTQVTKWAQFIVDKSSFPQTVLDHVTMEPAADGIRYHGPPETPPRNPPNRVWLDVLRCGRPMFCRNRIRFDAGYVVDVQFRVVGWTHKITRDRWEITWNTAPWHIVATTVSFHMGPHNNDRLNAGFLMGG
jgi:hypothetical protein